ncbi:MAG: hypothetical protein U0992_11625 [Planctomycetaceae bacterium]
MSDTRPRRFVRRVVMALAVAVLLPVWYVGAWLSIGWLANEGFISVTTAKMMRPAFAPILVYAESDMLGAEAIAAAYWVVNPPNNTTFVSGRGWPVYSIRPYCPLQPSRR